MLSNGRQGMIHLISPLSGIDLYSPIPNLNQPNTVAYDDGYVYFADQPAGLIGRRKFNIDEPAEFLQTKGSLVIIIWFL